MGLIFFLVFNFNNILDWKLIVQIISYLALIIAVKFLSMLSMLSSDVNRADLSTF